MSISAKTKKILYLQAGGICQNPGCNCDLIRFFESGDITNIDELAHIIGQKQDGPRGDNETPLNLRDEVDNIICLCPTCHTIIDKNPKEYPIDLLIRWKEEHLHKIKSVFKVPIFKTREELKTVINSLLRRNKMIFDTFGPYSSESENLLTSANKVWRTKAIEIIIPNNKKIVQLLLANEYLLNDEQKVTVEKFVLHSEEFEYNQISGDKNPYAPVYPQEINSILS